MTHRTPMLRGPVLAPLALALLAACAGRWYPSAAGGSADPSRAYLVAHALNQGCPLVGFSQRDARRALGRLHKVPSAPDAQQETWQRPVGRHGARLDLLFTADSLTSWRLVGEVDRSLAKRNADWAGHHAEGFPDRVEAYLRQHPATSAETAFLLFRACPQVGLTDQEVLASWGRPDKVDTLASTGSIQWEYGYGVEGQFDAVLFRQGRLVQFLYVDRWRQ